MLVRLSSVVLFAASRTSYDSMHELLNAPANSQQQNDQTRRWRDYKLEELSFVGITVGRSHQGRISVRLTFFLLVRLHLSLVFLGEHSLGSMYRVVHG